MKKNEMIDNHVKQWQIQLMNRKTIISYCFCFNFFFFFFFFFGQAIGQGKKSVIQRFTRQVDAQLFWRHIVHVKKNHDIKSGSGGSWGVYWLNAISQCVPLIDLLRKSHK